MVGPGHYAAFLVAAAAALAAGVLVGRRFAERRRLCAWALGSCVLPLVLYAVCLWRPAWEAAIFPWAFYAFWQKQWVYPPGIFVLACGGAMLPLRWNRAMVWTAAAALLGFSACAGRWMLRAPCPGSAELPVRGLVVEQSTDYTCAPAACATLLCAWGIEKSEHEMAQLSLCVPDEGTSIFHAYRGLLLAAEGSGLRPRLVAVDRRDAEHLVRPFAVGASAHAMVIFAVSGDRVLVGNPFTKRPRWCPISPLLDDWDGTAVLLCRNDPFDGTDAPHLGAWMETAVGDAAAGSGPAAAGAAWAK